MVERRQSKRRIMRDFVIKELSCVDNPAQGHARAVLMKRADDDLEKDYGEAGCCPAAVVSQEVQAVDFDTVLAEHEAREAAREVGEDLREKWGALQRSFATIAADESVSAADKISAMQESLQQYVDSLAEDSQDIAESMTKALTAVPAIAELLKQDGSEGGDPMTDAEKTQLAELQKSVADLTAKLEAATAKEPAKKAADLQGELVAAKAALAETTEKLEKAATEKTEAETLAKMSDAEKTHMAALSGADKMKFMQASPEDRKKMMSKAADADPVVYKAVDGTEFRKSDGDKVVALAKRADEAEKKTAAETEKREAAEFGKRADDDLKYFSEDVAKRDDKIECLRCISKMPDGPRRALEKMLEVGGKAIAAAFDTIGHKHEVTAKASKDFEKRITEVAARDKLPRFEAMRKAREEFPDEFKAYQEQGGAN